MGLFDFTSPQNDADRGRLGMKYFHNYSVRFPAYSGVTLNSLINTVGKAHGDIFLDGFGLAIREIGLSDGRLEDAMENLAQKSQGKIPDRNTFFSALSGEAMNLRFLDYVKGAPEIIQGTATDLVKGAQEVGNAVIDTGKTLTVIGPLLIVGLIVFVLVQKSKKLI